MKHTLIYILSTNENHWDQIQCPTYTQLKEISTTHSMIIKINLTFKMLSLWNMIFTTKQVPNIFLHGSKHILQYKVNASLDLKTIMWRTNYKLFIPFEKHMSNIKHLEYTNLKCGNSCIKLWQNFEGMEKIWWNIYPLQPSLTKKAYILVISCLNFDAIRLEWIKSNTLKKWMSM